MCVSVFLLALSLQSVLLISIQNKRTSSADLVPFLFLPEPIFVIYTVFIFPKGRCNQRWQGSQFFRVTFEWSNNSQGITSAIPSLPQDAHPQRRSRNKSSHMCFSLPLAFSRQSVLAAICIDFSFKKRRPVLILIRFLFLADARPVSYVCIGTLTMFSKLAGTEQSHQPMPSSSHSLFI